MTNLFTTRLAAFRTVALAGAMTFAPALAVAQAEKPQSGGTLNIGLVYYTLSPLSWDPADWPWKFGQDTGLMYEQLWAGDLSKAKSRGGKHGFVADACQASDGFFDLSWIIGDDRNSCSDRDQDTGPRGKLTAEADVDRVRNVTRSVFTHLPDIDHDAIKVTNICR